MLCSAETVNMFLPTKLCPVSRRSILGFILHPRQMRQKHCRSLHQPQEIGFELATFAGNQLVKYLVHFDFAVILAKHFWLGTTFQTRWNTLTGDRVQTCGSLNTSNFDSTNLCLPTKSGTFLAVLSASCFTFLGLLAFSFAEFEASGAVLLRFLGWQLIIYIPTFSVQPVLRNFMFFGLQPHQSLADAWPDAAGTKKRCLRRLLLPCLLHTAAAVVLFTVGVVTFDERHLGILPSFVVAAICVIPQTPLLLRLFGPPCVSKSSYPFRMLPLVATWTCTP